MRNGMYVSKRTWRALACIAKAHNDARGFLIYAPGTNWSGVSLNHLHAHWFW